MNTDELRKAAKCIYIQCPKEVADDIASRLNWAANKIDELDQGSSADSGGELVEGGYYWVKYQGNWECAKYESAGVHCVEGFWLTATDIKKRTEMFQEIGSRIGSPSND